MADWKDELSEELKAEPVIQNTKDVSGLAKQLVDSQKMIGGMVRIPGADAGDEAITAFRADLGKVKGVVMTPAADAKPEEIAAFYNKLGRPEKPEGYTAEAFKKDPEYIQIRDAAHKLGMSDGQFTDFYGPRAKFLDDVEKAHTENLTKWASALKGEYGESVEQVVDRAEKLLTRLAPDEFMKELNALGLTNNPGMVKMMTTLADELDEESVNRLFGGRSPLVVHPGNAQTQIDEIQANPEHPYHAKNRLMPGHDEAVAKMAKLYEILASVKEE